MNTSPRETRGLRWRMIHNRPTAVILSAAKDLPRCRHAAEILRCAQDDKGGDVTDGGGSPQAGEGGVPRLRRTGPHWRRILAAVPSLGTVLCTVVLAGVVAVVVASWLRPDIDWDATADGPNHLLRVYVFDAMLRRGEWFPRWVPDLYLGYGYPLFNFYAPGTYYVASALHRLGATVYGSVQLTGALAVALASGGAFALARDLCAGRRGAALLPARRTCSRRTRSSSICIAARRSRGARARNHPVAVVGVAPRVAAGGSWAPVTALLWAALLWTHNVSSLLAADCF